MADNKLKRKYRICMMLNEKEFKVLKKFLRKRKIQNKSKFFREVIIKYVIEQLVEYDYPKLFDNLGESETKETNTYSETDTNTQIQEETNPKLFEL